MALDLKKLHGEAASVDVSAVKVWINENSHTIKKYKPENVINVDETGFFYEQVQQSSYVLKTETDVKGKKV